MQLLLYLYDVATDPKARVKGGMAWSPLIAWIYGQTFSAILFGRKTLLRFKDCDAWSDADGIPQRRVGFVGDTPDLAERAVLSDTDLAFVLHLDPKAKGPDAYRVTDSDASPADLARLRAAIGDIPADQLFEAASIDRVRAALASLSV